MSCFYDWMSNLFTQSNMVTASRKQLRLFIRIWQFPMQISFQFLLDCHYFRGVHQLEARLCLLICGICEGIMEVMSSLMRWSCFANRELCSVSGLILSSGVSTSSRILAARQTLLPTLACWTLTIASWAWICPREDSEFVCLVLG